MVAQLRGCQRSQFFKWPVLEDVSDDALRDVADWLGFEHLTKYLTALLIERERIFERARY